MSSTYLIDRKRGSKEARQQLPVLRQKWPLAFPAEPKDVHPLAIGAAGEIASSMRWSLPYTLGVLASWKMGPPYCHAVLCHDHRVALDGSAAETIDADAKDLATKQLARLAARETAKKAKKAAGPADGRPTPAPVPLTETPGRLRARVRALLLGRTT
jgi:sRNA-binding protein